MTTSRDNITIDDACDYDNDTDDVMDYLKDDIIDQKDILDVDFENNKKIIPGIDLGTTNSCISIWRNNNCEIIPDEFGNKTIPSFVSYTNISKYIGNDAKNQQDINVENVFFNVKRLIGRTYADKAVQDCKDLLSYKIIENERGCVSIQSTVRNGKVFTPEEVSASVLMKLKDMAQKYLRCEIKDVVITVPAHFNDSQRQATYDAAKIAGLNCVRMFHEPTAAALAYGMLDRSINRALNNTIKNTSESETSELKTKNKIVDCVEDDMKGMMIIVYDFGGGTLDVSLIDVFDGAFDVQGSSGISHFGGVDFDNRLITYCITKFSRQFYKQDEKFDIKRLSRISLQKLRTQCESAKKILSTNAHAVIAIENFHDDKDIFVKISRTDFENLCRDLFLLCIHPIDELLAECGKTEKDIDEVILVGGMSRMPYVRELLNNKFRNETGKTRVNCSINPDEAVSIGAAIQGYYLMNKDDAFSSSVTLMDVIPLSLGVEVIGGVMDTLIKRNTMIPCEKTKLYSTDTDYIESVLVKIFEGERTMTQHNYKVGEFELNNLPNCQRGVLEIEICFAIDINGIVTVSAVEKGVNIPKSIIINTNKNGLKPHQLQALVEEAIEQETMDEIDRVKKYSYYEMEDLCSNVINNINNKEFKLTKCDIRMINDDITQIITWLNEKPCRERDLSEFEDALHKMKKKYGVLILHGKIEDSKVKAVADHMEATTLYCKDDDDEEEEMRQAFEKVKKDEIYGDGMTDSELIEIKDMRNALMMTCKEINNVICSGRMNITRDHKQEILHYIDDVMMWYYSHEKPKKIDYKEKIDYVNSICDEIVEQYETSGKDLFEKGVVGANTDSNSQKLEKLCLILITMIKNKQLMGSTASFALFTHKLQNILKFVYSKESGKDGSTYNTKTSDTEQTTILSTMSDEDFQITCLKHMTEVNNMCDNIYNDAQGININNCPVVCATKPKTQVVQENVNLTHCINNNQNKEDQQGMSLVELLRIKQNEEIDDMIDKQLTDVCATGLQPP